MKWFSFFLIALFLVSPPITLIAAEQQCQKPKMVAHSTMTNLHCQNCSATQNHENETSLKPEQESSSKPISELILTETSAIDNNFLKFYQKIGVSPELNQGRSLLHLYCVLII